MLALTGPIIVPLSTGGDPSPNTCFATSNRSGEFISPTLQDKKWRLAAPVFPRLIVRRSRSTPPVRLTHPLKGYLSKDIDRALAREESLSYDQTYCRYSTKYSTAS